MSSSAHATPAQADEQFGAPGTDDAPLLQRASTVGMLPLIEGRAGSGSAADRAQVMTRSGRSRSARKTMMHVVLLLLGLVVPLALVWEADGPPADRAFWLVLGYFIEIAVWIAADIVRGIVRGLRDEA